MAKTFRVIDTGIDSGRRNIAFDRALIDARIANEVPDTIRFLRFRPTALVGRHQALNREVDVPFCQENGIGLARRITGGGSIFFDQGQLGWELAFARSSLPVSDLGQLSQVICEAAAGGIRRLGVDAQFRPRNDIEVGGRKISGTGGFFEGDVLFYQGTLLIDTNPELMAQALRIPQAKLAKRNLDKAADRVVTLSALLPEAVPPIEEIKAALIAGFEEGLGISSIPGETSDVEKARWMAAHDEEIGTDAFVAEIDDPETDDGFGVASAQTPGGTITVYVKQHRTGTPRIQQVLITGDFFAAPPRLVFDLEAALRDVSASEVEDIIAAFFAESDGGAMSIPTEEVAKTIRTAFEVATVE